MSVVLFTLPIIGDVSLATALAVGGTIASMLMNKPHQQTPTFKSMSSAWGNTWPIVYNNFRVAGQVIQAGPVIKHSGKNNVFTKKSPDSFSQTFAVGFCEGDKQLGRIWADNKVIYDPRPITAPDAWQALTDYAAGDIVLPTAGGTVQFTATVNAESGASEPTWDPTTNALTNDGSQVWIASPYVARAFIGNAYNFSLRIYSGSETQLPDVALEEIVGTGNQPAYRGLMYVVFEDFDLTQYGNRIPNLEAELLAGPEPFSGTLALDGTKGSTPSGCLIEGDDGQHYVAGPGTTGFFTTIALGHAETGTDILELSAAIPFTQWLNDFAALGFAGASGFGDFNSEMGQGGIPIQGKGFYATANNGTFTQQGFVRYGLDGSAKGGLNYSNTEGVAGRVGGGWCRGASTINDEVYALVWMGFGSGGSNFGNGMWELARLPADGTVEDLTPGSWNLRHTQIVPVENPIFNVVTGREFWNRAGILEDAGGIGILSYSGFAEAGGNPADSGSRYWLVAPLTQTVVISNLDVRAEYGQPFDDEGKDYSGAASIDSRNAYSGPSIVPIIGGAFIFFGRPFTDRPTTFRIRKFFRDTATGSVTAFDTVEITINGPIEAMSMIHVSEDGVVGVTDSATWYFGRLPSSPLQTLADVCEDQSLRVGLTPSQLNYTDLESVIPRGAALLQRVPSRTFIESLQPAFLFDLTDIGDQIVGTLRSESALLLSIPEDELAAGTDPTTIIDKISTVRHNDLEIPKDLSLSYYDFNHDYQQNSQQAKRNAVTQYSSGKSTINVPVVMTPGEAASAALRDLHLLWIERNLKSVALPIKYLKITPTDVIGVTRGTREHFIRASKTKLEPTTMIISVESVSEDFGIYSLVATPSLSDLTGGTFTSSTIVPVVPPLLEVMDTATLRSSDLNDPGVYLAGARSDAAGAWTGEVVYESQDNSVFSQAAAVDNESAIGTAITTLGDWPRWTVWDDTNSIDIQMTNGALANASRDDLVNNFTNAAWLSSGEIIQFTTATPLTADTYRLTGLLRGRFGTDAFLRSHVIGEIFVMLDSTTMQNATYSPSDINALRYWKGLNNSAMSGGSSGVKTLTMATRRLLPYAPYFIDGSRDGGLNLTITGLRRMRWRGRPLWTPPETDMPVAMEIDILDAASPPNVVRTLTSTLSGAGSGIIDASSFEAYYAATDQVSDFGSAQSSLNIVAYETNAMIGRGYGRAAAV